MRARKCFLISPSPCAAALRYALRRTGWAYVLKGKVGAPLVRTARNPV